MTLLVSAWQVVGCDHKLDSSKQEDKCLQCGGDGSTCYPVSGTFDVSDLSRGGVLQRSTGSGDQVCGRCPPACLLLWLTVVRARRADLAGAQGLPERPELMAQGEAQPCHRSPRAPDGSHLCPHPRVILSCCHLKAPLVPPPSALPSQSGSPPLAFAKLFPLGGHWSPGSPALRPPVCPSPPPSVQWASPPSGVRSGPRVSRFLRLQPDPHRPHGGHQHPHRGGGCQQEFPG